VIFCVLGIHERLFIILMNCFLCAGFVSPGSGVAQVGVFLFSGKIVVVIWLTWLSLGYVYYMLI
jgi:hypothetical protein